MDDRFETPRNWARSTPMAADLAQNHQHEEAEDELDKSPLAVRLREMSWPEAPSDVKERVLERILSEHPGLGRPEVLPQSQTG